VVSLGRLLKDDPRARPSVKQTPSGAMCQFRASEIAVMYRCNTVPVLLCRPEKLGSKAGDDTEQRRLHLPHLA
jgi:hypothetical protein